MAGRRALSIAAAVVGLGAGVGLWLVGRAPAAVGPAREEVAAIADDLDIKIREVAAGVGSRAQTLSEFPRLSNAVATDAATVLDMVNEELTFRPREGETIAIGQIDAKGQLVTLLELPKGAATIARLEKVGTSVGGVPDNLLVTNVVSFKPTAGTGVKEGRVGVTIKLALAPYMEKLNALGVPAWVEVGGKALATTGKPFPAGAEPTALPFRSATGARLMAVVRPVDDGKLGPLQLGGLAAAAVGLLLGAVLWPRGHKPTAAEVITAPMQPSPLPGVLPGGTPVPFAATQSGAPPSNLVARTPTEIGQFGRYFVMRRLGSGGMAEVFLARITGEAGFEKKVALKIIHKHLSVHQQVVDHFLDEARLASQISHPNICQIIDLGKAGDDYYIAMEYVDGYDLDTMMEMSTARGGLVPARVALSVLRRICSGLHAAHTAVDHHGKPLELVHRDVKAENILVSRVGEIKVTDFGIAKANVRAAKTQIGMVKGTAAYMAPEQRIGQTVDRRADIYGAGAIAYELLTGQEINLDLATLAHLGKEGWPHLPPVSQYRPDLPAEIDQIVFKALAYDKEDRWATALAFEEELEQYAERHNLVGPDKLVAQWVEQEIAYIEAQAKSNGAA